MGELKPGSRTSAGPMTLLDSGREQCLSHLGKILQIGLNFAGVGVPAHATGFVAIMAAIQILHLEILDVGTPGVRLELYQTDLLQLMKLQAFDKWASTVDKKHKKQFHSLRDTLYGKDGKKGLLQACDIPLGYIALGYIALGYIALVKMMITSRRKLFGLEMFMLCIINVNYYEMLVNKICSLFIHPTTRTVFLKIFLPLKDLA